MQWRKKKQCKRKKVQKHYIEDIVVGKCRKLLTDKNIDKIAKKVYTICSKDNAQSCLEKVLVKEQKDLQKKIDNLIVAIEDGQNLDMINNRLTQQRMELEQVNKRLEKEQSKLVNVTEEQIKFFLTMLKNGDINDLKYRKTLVNIFINKIYLYDDRLTIIFNIGKKKVEVNNLLLTEIENNFKKVQSLYTNKLRQPRRS